MDNKTQKVIDLLKEVLAASQPDEKITKCLKAKIQMIKDKVTKLTNLSKTQAEIITKLTDENEEFSKQIIRMTTRIAKKKEVNIQLQKESDEYFIKAQDLHLTNIELNAEITHKNSLL